MTEPDGPFVTGDPELRLGEGSGAVLTPPLPRAACTVLAEMATFAEAGVSGAD